MSLSQRGTDQGPSYLAGPGFSTNAYDLLISWQRYVSALALTQILGSLPPVGTSGLMLMPLLLKTSMSAKRCKGSVS